MNMEAYLKEIEFAVTPIILAIWYEHAQLEKIEKKYERAINKVLKEHKRNSGRWVSSQSVKVLDQTGNAMNSLKQRIATREFAVSMLAGSLLQFSKQGISIVYGDINSCPNGPFIGSQNLKSVIWHGRNQSLHWEDQPLSKSVNECFRKLSLEFGLMRFGMFQHQNLGFNIIQLLEWKSYTDFRASLLQLC